MLLPFPFQPPGDASAYAHHGPKLVDLGYVAVPCRPGSKVPGEHHTTPTGASYWINMHRWNQAFTDRLPTDEEMETWSRWPGNPGVCLVLGRAGGARIGVGAFDIDADPEKMPRGAEVQAALREVIPPSPVAKVGRLGETRLFQVPEGLVLPSRPFSIGGIRALDVLSDGRQTVLPPTIHPDTGEPYRWLGEDLCTVRVEDLPVIDETIFGDIEAALRPFGYEPRHNPTARAPGARLDTGASTPFRSLNDHALANLDSWVPRLGLYNAKRTHRGYDAVPYWRPNAKGLPLEERGRSLSIHSLGIRDMSADEGLTPIDLCMKAMACDLDTAFAFLARSTGWAGDVPDIELNMPIVAAPLVVREIAPPPAKVEVEPEEDLTRVPGLIGEIIDWIEASAESPSRELALGAALAVVGTLIGRRYAGPTMSGTHLYVTLIGPTASGKDWPQSAAGRLLKAAGAEHHIGPDEYASISACIKALADATLHLSIIDELGAFIRRINARNASTHEQGISKFLRSTWGKSFDTYRSPEWAGKKKVVVNAPAVSILGGSTIEELLGSFAEQDVTNGMLNRFLFFVLPGYPADRRPTASKEVPEFLAAMLKGLYESQGVPATVLLNEPSTVPDPVVVPFEDDEAREVYERFRLECRERQRKDAEASAFVARTAEMALRIATIRAVSLDPLQAGITAEDMRWGRAIALRSCESMRLGAARLIGRTETQALADKVMDYVRSHKDGVSHRDLHRAIGRRYPSKVFADIIKGLKEDSEVLKIERAVSPDGSRVSLWYRAEEE